MTAAGLAVLAATLDGRRQQRALQCQGKLAVSMVRGLWKRGWR